MALKVSTQVINLSGTDVKKIKFLTFSSIHDNGIGGFWTPASLIQKETGARNAIALSLTQGCNSLAYAVLTASKMISAQEEALVVSSEKFSGTEFNRWSSDAGVLYGDAAVAVLLSKIKGIACIRYLDAISVPELEGMHRGENFQTELSERWNIANHKYKWMERNGRNMFFDLMKNAISIALKRLKHAGYAEPHSHSIVVMPFVGKSILENLYEPSFAFLGYQTMRSFGMNTGHTGPGDQFLGLERFLSTTSEVSGRKTALLIGAGAGFTLTVMVIEISKYNSQHNGLVNIIH